MTPGQILPAGTEVLDAGDYECFIQDNEPVDVANRYRLFSMGIEFATWDMRYPNYRFTLHRDYQLATATNYRVRYLGPPSREGLCTLERTDMQPGDFQRVSFQGHAQILDQNGNAYGHQILCPGLITVPSTAPSGAGIFYTVRFTGIV